MQLQNYSVIFEDIFLKVFKVEKLSSNKIRQLLIFSYFDDHLNPRYSADRASDGNATTTALTKRERNPWYVATLDQEYKALMILIEGNSYNSGDIFTGAKHVFIDHGCTYIYTGTDKYFSSFPMYNFCHCLATIYFQFTHGISVVMRGNV